MINLNKASQQIGNTPSKTNKEYIIEIWNAEFNWQICSFYKMYFSSLKNKYDFGHEIMYLGRWDSQQCA